MNELEELEKLKKTILELCEEAGSNEDQYLFCNKTSPLSVIEEELKDYHEIKEIAERYHFDDLARDTHMTTTDEKYLRLFNAAIPDIQADYRKARAFDIIKEKGLSTDELWFIKNDKPFEEYVETLRELNYGDDTLEERLKTEDEFYSLKRAMK